MIIEDKIIDGKNLRWILRCPRKEDANELSKLRAQIDGETENLDRESGESFLTPEDFEGIIFGDNTSKLNLFFVAEVGGKIVGFSRLEGNKLVRFRHKAEFGICILKKYWGYGIGRVILENILRYSDSSDIKKVSLSAVETNTKAIELYKSYGFVKEGLLINDRIHKDGKYYNTVIMGRINSNNY